MNNLLRKIADTDKNILYSVVFSACCIVVIVFFFALSFTSLPPSLPLLYSRPWGVSQLVSKSQFLILPIVVILITMLNTLLASRLHPAQQVLRKILLDCTIFVDIIILIATLKIIWIFF